MESRIEKIDKKEIFKLKTILKIIDDGKNLLMTSQKKISLKKFTL